MPETDPPPLPDPLALAALDLTDESRVAVAQNLALLAEHWRRFAEPDE